MLNMKPPTYFMLQFSSLPFLRNVLIHPCGTVCVLQFNFAFLSWYQQCAKPATPTARVFTPHQTGPVCSHPCCLSQLEFFVR